MTSRKFGEFLSPSVTLKCLFDCCKQSLTRLIHPPTHPGLHAWCYKGANPLPFCVKSLMDDPLMFLFFCFRVSGQLVTEWPCWTFCLENILVQVFFGPRALWSQLLMATTTVPTTATIPRKRGSNDSALFVCFYSDIFFLFGPNKFNLWWLFS